MAKLTGPKADQAIIGGMLERASEHYDVSNWEVLGVREGLVEAAVPLGDVLLEDDPVMMVKVQEYADDIKINGQLERVLTGLVVDVDADPHRVANGLHRQRALHLLGEGVISTSIMPDVKIDELQARRIRATKGIHDESEILRVARWSDDVWSRTDWSGSFGVRDAFEYSAYASMRRESPITKRHGTEVEEWVKSISEQWGMPPKLIVKYLRIGEGFDDEVLGHVTTKKVGFTKAAAEITVQAFSEVVDLETGETDYDLPYVLLVATTANRLGLTTAQIKELNFAIMYEPIEKAQEIAARFKPSAKTTNVRASNPKNKSTSGNSDVAGLDLSKAGTQTLVDVLYNKIGHTNGEQVAGGLKLSGAERRRFAEVGKSLLGMADDDTMIVIDLRPPKSNGQKHLNGNDNSMGRSKENGRLRVLHDSVSSYLLEDDASLPQLPPSLDDKRVVDAIADAIRKGFQTQDSKVIARIKTLQAAITDKYRK